MRQGLKKVLFSHPGQLDFSDGQEHFHSFIFSGQGLRQKSCQPNPKKVNSDLPRKAKFKSCLSEVQAGIKVFLALYVSVIFQALHVFSLCLSQEEKVKNHNFSGVEQRIC